MMDVPKIYRQLQEAAASHGFACESYGQIGEYSLPAFRRDANGDLPRIYLSAGIHGDEPAGVHGMLRLLQSGFFNQQANWLICPLLNPTGLAANKRENFQGLDLNRDYRALVSEEIRAHRSWLASQKPYQLALSLHEDWETTGFYLYEINTSSRPCLGPAILQETSKIIATETNHLLDDHEVTSPGYILHRPEADEPSNWPEAIYHVKLHPLLSCTFETPSQLPLEQRILTHMTAVETAVEKFLS